MLRRRPLALLYDVLCFSVSRSSCINHSLPAPVSAGAPRLVFLRPSRVRFVKMGSFSCRGASIMASEERVSPQLLLLQPGQWMMIVGVNLPPFVIPNPALYPTKAGNRQTWGENMGSYQSDRQGPFAMGMDLDMIEISPSAITGNPQLARTPGPVKREICSKLLMNLQCTWDPVTFLILSPFYCIYNI